MTCCGFGDPADQHFNSEKVEQELRKYRRRGPGVTTRKLRDGLVAAGVTRGTVLDVGGGLGALSLALLDTGMNRASVVDASSAYLAAASEEAARRKRSACIPFVHGDFLTVARDLGAAAVVTLDRVVCGYPAYRPLLQQSLEHAERGFALSYLRDRWFVRLAVWLRTLRDGDEESVSHVCPSTGGTSADDRGCWLHARQPRSDDDVGGRRTCL
jgi:hypothetical protein